MSACLYATIRESTRDELRGRHIDTWRAREGVLAPICLFSSHFSTRFERETPTNDLIMLCRMQMMLTESVHHATESMQHTYNVC